MNPERIGDNPLESQRDPEPSCRVRAETQRVLVSACFGYEKHLGSQSPKHFILHGGKDGVSDLIKARKQKKKEN